MTSTVRYKYVKNQTNQILTADNFVSSCMISNDGDDRQFKIVKRMVTAADIGTAVGQIGNYNGAILDVIQSGQNVLWVQCTICRGTMTNPNGYDSIDNQVYPIPTPTIQTQLQFALYPENIIRVIDISEGTAAAIRDGDIITAFIVTGYPQLPSDVMNPYP